MACIIRRTRHEDQIPVEPKGVRQNKKGGKEKERGVGVEMVEDDQVATSRLGKGGREGRSSLSADKYHHFLTENPRINNFILKRTYLRLFLRMQPQ